jgi:hypothetical protein
MKIIRMIYLYLLFLSLSAFPQYYTQQDSIDIAVELNSTYQSNFVVNVILNIDSVVHTYDYSEGRIVNPYNTLNGCLVFLASQFLDSLNFGNSLLGIYREQQVVWNSAYTITPANLRFGSIYGIMDLNTDGGVDIISVWKDKEDNYQSKYLWVFSWDGSDGMCINDIKNNSSVIFTHGYSEFNTIDIEGDGIWEIIGYGATEELNYNPDVYYWNGQKYVLSNTTINSVNYFFPRNNIEAYVNCSVKKESNLVYQYSVINDILSAQDINEFYLVKKTDSLFNFTSPTGWDKSIFENLFEWYDTNFYSAKGLFITKNRLHSGGEFNFSFETLRLPSIQNYYLRGYNYPNLDPESNDDEYNNIYENSKIGVTLVPAEVIEPFIPLNFLDTLINYNQRSLELDWITNQTTADKYDSLLTTAKTLLEGNHIPWVDSTLQTVLEEVDEDSSGNITSEAYALLRYNTEYLLENLPEVIPPVLNSISPSLALPYDLFTSPTDFTVTAAGGFFSDSSVVFFDGEAKPTTIVSDSVLTFQLNNETDIPSVDDYPVWVSTYGVNSDTINFSVVSSLNALIIPTLQCVRNNGGGSFTAYFGYNNSNIEAVFIAVNQSNHFTPGSPLFGWDRGQPEIFLPGNHTNVFSVNFDGNNLTWNLVGSSVTANKKSTACP